MRTKSRISVLNKSVLKPSAQIEAPCKVVSNLESDIILIRNKLQRNKSKLGKYYQLFIFQLETGARITEALNIQHNDISSSGKVYLRGLKNSDDRLIYLSDLAEFFYNHKIKRLDPFKHLNRFTAYRLLKNMHIGKVKRGRLKASITHVFRDEYIKDSRQLTDNERLLSQSVGQRSEKSAGYYGK